jgi:protein O-mannosyl-transferase
VYSHECCSATWTNFRMTKNPGRFEAKIRFRWWWLIVVLVVTQGALEIYSAALRGPFLFDDFSLPFYAPLTRTSQLSAWVHGVRPLLMFSYWINYILSGQETLWYHIFNVLFHTVNAFLVCGITWRLLAMANVQDGRREILAAFAGALFLVHPLQTESVAYVAGRSESLSALFYLLAFAIYLSRPPRGIGWKGAVLVLLLSGAAVTTKEHTLTLPVALLLTDIFWSEHSPSRVIRRNWRLYYPLAAGAMLGAVFVWSVLSRASTAGFRVPGVTWYSYLLTQFRVIFVYIRLFVFPAGQNLDYDISLSTVSDPVAWAGLAVLAILSLVAFRYRKEFPLPAYGWFLFLLLLAPTSSIVPIQDPIAERRLYLPILGLLLVTVGFLARVKVPSRVALASSLSAVLMVAAVLAYQRNTLWGSEAAIWEDTLAKSPNKRRDFPHLVHGYVSEHRCNEALQRLESYTQRNALDSVLLIHWAYACECLNQRDAAAAKLEQAAGMSEDPSVLLMIAQHQMRLRSPAKAVDALNRVVRINPGLETAYLLRGDAYLQQGRTLMAAEDYRRALRVNPANDRVRAQLQRMRDLFGLLQVGN